MRTALTLVVALLAGLGIGWAAFSPKDKPADPKANPIDHKVTTTSDQDLVAKGKYLVTIMACADCHTPHDQTGQPIKGREFSGHPEAAPMPTWNPGMLKDGNVATIAPTLTAFATPLGVAAAPNLTPDMETGLTGVMTLETFTQIFRSGQHWKGGRPVMPPMPVGFYKEMKDEDIKAVYSYLKSLPAVKNKVPESTFTPPPTAPAAPATGH